MSILLKKVTSTVSVVAILASAMSSTLVANAGSTFTPYADALATAGIIGKQSTEAGYNLGNNVTRAEMAKIAVNIKGASVAECTGTVFSDVTSTLGDLCGYVEAAATAGLVNKTAAKFRPMDLVSRAEMLKMLLGAKGIAPTTEDQGFTDLGSDASLNGFINAAAKAGIINKGTSFNPNNTASRGESFKVAANSAGLTTSAVEDTSGDLNLGDLFGDTGTGTTSTGTTSTGTTSTGTTSTVAAGDLEVALSPTSPAATNVPCNAQSLVFAKYDFTAGSADASITALTLKRTGLGTKDDFSKVWLENKDGIRVTSRQTIGTDDVVVLNFSPALVVKAGSTETLSLTAKLKAFNDNVTVDGIKQSTEACYTGRMDAFTLAAASDVATGGKATGTYPMTSAMMSTADYATANLTSSVVSSAPTYQVGELSAEFAQWKLTNGSNTKDITMKTLTVKNEGTGKIAKDLSNFKVVVNGVTISTSAIVSGENVTFSLGNYTLAAGRTETFYVRADIVGMDSATSDNIKLTVRYAEDVNAIEATTGFGVSHDLDTVMTTTAVTPVSTYIIQGGDTTFVKSSTAPASVTKPKGATKVTLLESNLIVKQDFTTDAIKVTLFTNQATAALAADDLKNIKLYVDGQIIQTKSGDAADFLASTVAVPATFTTAFTLNFDSTVILKQGTRVISVVADIETSTSVATHKFRAEIAGAGNTSAFLSAKYVANDRTISAVAGTVTGGDVTIGASNLTVTENSGYAAAQKFVAGAQNLVAAKYTLKANDSDSVKITSLKFNLIGAGVNGSDIPSASVYVDGKQVGSTKSFTTGTAGSVDFTDVNFTVPSNGQAVVELRVNLTNSALNTLQVELAQINAKDTNSTDATINNLTNDTTAHVTAVAATGSLTVTAVIALNTITATVGGVAISAAVPFNTSLAQTTTDLITSINTVVSVPDYTAVAGVGAGVITISAAAVGTTANTLVTSATLVQGGAAAAPTVTNGVMAGGVNLVAGGYQSAFNAKDSINLNVVTGGVLAITSNSNTPTSSVLVASSAQQEIAKFTLSSQDDDIRITNLYFKTVNDTAGNATVTDISSRVSTISLYDNAGVKVADGIVSGNYVYFDIGASSTLVVPKNSNSYTISVKAAFNPITQSAQTGNVFKLVVGGVPGDAVSGTEATSGIRAVSTGNNTVLSAPITAGAVSSAMMLTKTRLSFASVDDSVLVSNVGNTLGVNSAFKAYAFSVTADAAGDAELASVVLDISTSAAAATTFTNVKVYEKNNEANILFNGAYTSLNTVPFTTAQRISAGTTKTYIVELNINAAPATSSLSVRLVSGANDTAFTTSPTIAVPLAGKQTVWSDLSNTAHTTPATATDWFTGYKVTGISSMSSRSYSKQ